MKLIVAILCATCIFLSGSQQAIEYIQTQGRGDPYVRPPSDTIPLFVPEPQAITWFNDSCFVVNDSTIIACSNYADSVAARTLHEEIVKSCSVNCTIVYDSLIAANAIILRRRGDFSEVPLYGQQDSIPQGYSIYVNHNYCVITGDDLDGLFFGSMTFKQLVAQHEGCSLKGVLICDYPDLPVRGNYVFCNDIANWVDSMKSWTAYFATLKMNKLILESYAYWGGWSNSVTALDAFYNWCRAHHVEPIPLLQSLGHGGNIVSRNPASGEAVYRKREHFCSINDTLRCLADTNIFSRPSSIDMGFDSVSGNNFTEWEQTDIGVTIFSDEVSQHAGLSCVKINRATTGTSWLWQELSCTTNTLYTLWFYIKTQSVYNVAQDRGRRKPALLCYFDRFN